METPKRQPTPDALLAILRGPLLLYAISLILLIAAVPAEAVLLQGYLQDENDEPGQSMSLPAAINLDSFPESFAGMWKCMTVVVDSAVSSVEIGQRMESQVEFAKADNGKILAHWSQPGWTESEMSVTALNDREADLKRTNQYAVQGGGMSSWTAESTDHYLQVEDNQIVAVSSVDQFINGQYLGRYQTKSVLVRVSDSPIAMK
jgi:hypothetical protein